ncbi:MAG: hypothetical protein R6W72_07735 [Desulfurivibrionaceae bacterium]
MKKALVDFPEWKAASERLGELQLELGEMDRQHQAGLQSLQQAEQMRAADRLTKEAEAYIGGDTPAGPAITREEVEGLAHRRKLLLRAVELQKQRMSTMRAQLSAEICKALRPAYSQIISDMAGKVAALAKAAEAERLFREGLRDGDIAFTGHLPPVPLRGGWDQGDEYSPSIMFHREAKAAGYL